MVTIMATMIKKMMSPGGSVGLHSPPHPSADFSHVHMVAPSMTFDGIAVHVFRVVYVGHGVLAGKNVPKINVSVKTPIKHFLAQSSQRTVRDFCRDGS